MSALSLTFSDLYREISNFLGLGLAPAGDNLTLAKKYANDGYRLFLMGADPRTGRAYPWSFLSPEATLDLWPALAPDEAVTVTGVCANGVTTLSAAGGEPFLPSMEGRTIAITGAGEFVVRTFVSTSSITVAGDATCEGATFALDSSGAFGLPADFAAMMDDPSPFRQTGTSQGCAPSASAGCLGGALRPRSAAYIRELQSRGGAGSPGGTGFQPVPLYYAIQPRPFEAGVGQRYDLLVWPTPSAPLTLRFRCRVEPAALAADGDLPLGGPQHALAILEAGLAVAEQRHNDTRGIHTEQLAALMAAAIDLDAANKPHNLGDSGGGPAAEGPVGGERAVNLVRYQ